MKLTQEIMAVLEKNHFLTYLCTSSRDGRPSGRMVAIIPSDDLDKIYVPNGRFNKAEKDLKENKKTMFVFYSPIENPYDMKGFQIECECTESTSDKNNEIFKKGYEVTKNAMGQEEAENLKCVYTFIIKQIYDCSMDGGGNPIGGI